VYPRKSNSPSGTLQIRVFSFTAIPDQHYAIVVFNDAMTFGLFASHRSSENRTALSAWSSVESNVGTARCSGPIGSPISVHARMTLSAPA